MNIVRKFLLVMGLVALHIGANATVINATNSGWYVENGGSNGKTGNTCTTCYGSYRNWIGFDLSGVSGVVTSATLSIYSNENNDANQQMNWWDISSAYSALGMDSVSVYDDLGTGSILASGVQNPGVYNDFVFNTMGLDNLTNALGEMWAVGGVNISGGVAFGYNGGVGTDPAFYQLNIQGLRTQPVRRQGHFAGRRQHRRRERRVIAGHLLCPKIAGDFQTPRYLRTHRGQGRAVERGPHLCWQ